jgi:hypothetical protein
MLNELNDADIRDSLSSPSKTFVPSLPSNSLPSLLSLPGPGDALESISLKNLNTGAIGNFLSLILILVNSADLWANNPALILVIRRPGCAFCRDEARALSSQREYVKNNYGVSMFLVVHQEEAWEDLSHVYWKDDVYLDPRRGFYKALGKGKFATIPIEVLLNPATYFRFAMVF